jgi:hypothetical protein
MPRADPRRLAMESQIQRCRAIKDKVTVRYKISHVKSKKKHDKSLNTIDNTTILNHHP